MAEINIPTGPLRREPLDAIHALPGDRAEAKRQALADALAGLELGTWDRSIVDWLVGREPSAVATICAWLHRARAAGPVATEPADQLYSITTTNGTWQYVEHHTRPLGDVDLIACHIGENEEPLLYGFRRDPAGVWWQVSGEWTHLDTARHDVARELRVMAIDGATLLFFLDSALAGGGR